MLRPVLDRGLDYARPALWGVLDRLWSRLRSTGSAGL